ncbi:MAG TPA: NCS2 family permease [Terriglobales bacterium]|nr:NCS2 family permease [Terriglobales bacterium]
MSSTTGAAAEPVIEAQPASFLDRRFEFRARGARLGAEIIAGATTFVTAAYLTVVVPNILASGGMDRAAVTTSVIVMFVLGTLFMALYANLPFVVGPGIGGSALVATVLASTEGIPWQTGMAIAFWSGVLFFVLTLLGMREVVVRIVPVPVKMALSPAIGLFIALLGFRNGGLVVANAGINALTLGNLAAPGALVALIGLAAAVALYARKVPGGILIAMLIATLAGIPLGVTKLPPSLFGLPHSVGAVAFQLDFLAALRPSLLPYLFAFFAAEFFSTMGTTLAVGAAAGLVDERGNMPRINGPFVVDSCAASIGPFFGVPSMTALIESAAGAEAGGRTGFTSVVTAALFALSLLFAPVILMVPKEATAAALILVGLAMFTNLRKIDLARFTGAFPAVLTVLVTLVANNFGTGIAAGILSYVFIHVLAGKARELPLGLYLLTLPLLYFFWTMGTRH